MNISWRIAFKSRIWTIHHNVMAINCSTSLGIWSDFRYPYWSSMTKLWGSITGGQDCIIPCTSTEKNSHKTHKKKNFFNKYLQRCWGVLSENPHAFVVVSQEDILIDVSLISHHYLEIKNQLSNFFSTMLYHQFAGKSLTQSTLNRLRGVLEA